MKVKFTIPGVTLLLALSLVACSTTADETEVLPTDSNVEVTDSSSSEETETSYVYATMNIPYDDFFKAELTNNDISVDAVTTATPTQWQQYDYTYSRAAEDGTDGGVIYGPQFPVRMKEALFNELSAEAEDADYAVSLLDSEPTTYKEVAMDESGNLTFSEIIGGTETVLEEGFYSYYHLLPSAWSDFEIRLSNLPEMETIYGAEVVTASGKTYGLRTLENVYSTNGQEISWSLGYRIYTGKGSTLAPEHYEDMQGDTITELIYYVPEGTVVVPLDLYVPYYFAETWFTIGEQEGVGVSHLTCKDTLSATIDYVDDVVAPDDFELLFQVMDRDTREYIDADQYFSLSDDMSTLYWTEDLPFGEYNIEFADANGVYMTYGTKVLFWSDIIPAVYNESTFSFDPADGFTQEDADFFTSGLSKYTVLKAGDDEAVSYSLKGSSAVPLFNEDGTLNLEAEGADGAVFEAGETYTVTMSTTYYTDYQFTFTK